ncbi:MAG: hypothetical protein EBZ52_00500 [Actinobacteria bacterium]|nr:hypothetical protein [Actinomycetota bacterium]
MITHAAIQIALAEATTGLRVPVRNAVSTLATTLFNAQVSRRKSREQLVDEVTESSEFSFPTPSLLEFDFALATSTGKTRLALALIELLVAIDQSRTFVVLVHRDLLKKRWISEFDIETCERIGHGRKVVVAESASDLANRPVDPEAVLILVQTLQALSVEDANWAQSIFSQLPLDEEIRLRGDTIAIVDESHHVFSGDEKSIWMSKIETLLPKMFFGLTATPNRSRPVLFEYSLKDLLYDGKYSKKLEFVYEEQRLSEIDRHSLALSRSLGELRRKQSTILSLPSSHPLRVSRFIPRLLVAVSTVEDVQSVAARLVDEFGLNEAEILRVSSKVSSDALLETLLELDSNSEVLVVVAAYMLDEGWDVTNVAVICPLRALASPSNAKQLVGRGLRLPLGKRSGVDDADTLTVVSIGQESLAEMRAEVTKEFGIVTQVVQPGKNSKEVAGDDDSVGPVDCEVEMDSSKLNWILNLTPFGVAVDWRVSIPKIAGQKSKVAVIDAGTGGITARPDSKVARRAFRGAIEELSATSPMNTCGEIEHVLRSAGYQISPDLQLEANEISQLTSELGRITFFQFSNLVGESLLIPDVVATRGQYSTNEAVNQRSGWVERPGLWFAGFSKSVAKFARFDSEPEFDAAQILDGLDSVVVWLRNDPKVLRIQCPSQTFSVDFIASTEEVTYLLEIKGRHLLPAFREEVGLLKSVENWCEAQQAESNRQFIFKILDAENVHQELLSLAESN